MKWDNV